MSEKPISDAMTDGAIFDRLYRSTRTRLVERFIEARSTHAIGGPLRVPVGTVGSRLATAKRLLRKVLPRTPVRIGGDPVPEPRTQDIAEQALKRLTEELQAGRSDALNTYLAAIGRFHRYSWNNVMLIQTQRPTATRVAGFHTWHELGRSVRRGEKGIRILAPMRIKREKPELDPEGLCRQERVAGFRTAYVFDLEQTEGKPLPEPATTTGDPRDHADRLKAFVAAQGIVLEYNPGIAPAQGLSCGGRIELQPGMPAAEEFSVLAHELAHELLHHKGEPRLPKTVVETQAEAVAFVVCRGIGLETNTAAADYITLYTGDPNTLAESLSVIQRTSARILDELLPDERIGGLERHPADSLECVAVVTPPALEDAARQPDKVPLTSEPLPWDR